MSASFLRWNIGRGLQDRRMCGGGSNHTTLSQATISQTNKFVCLILVTENKLFVARFTRQRSVKEYLFQRWALPIEFRYSDISIAIGLSIIAIGISD
jgi:hypothetical protein